MCITEIAYQTDIKVRLGTLVGGNWRYAIIDALLGKLALGCGVLTWSVC